MSKTIIHAPQAPAAVGPYSHAVLANNMLYVSGQLPIDPATGQLSGDISQQTSQVMRNLLAIVEHAGAGAKDIVKVTIYLANMNDFATVNEIYASYFTGDYPARVAIGISALPKGALVEMDAIVAL